MDSSEQMFNYLVGFNWTFKLIIMKITKDIQIEDLVDNVPDSVAYLADEGIRCLRCGEPIWGSLEEAAREKGYDDEKIRHFVNELQEMADKKE